MPGLSAAARLCSTTFGGNDRCYTLEMPASQFVVTRRPQQLDDVVRAAADGDGAPGRTAGEVASFLRVRPRARQEH